MPNYSDIPFRVEEAMAALVSAVAVENLSVRKGFDVSEVTLPCCICSCNSLGPESIRDTGNYPASCSVEIVTAADPSAGTPGSNNDALTVHRNIVATVFDVFNADEDSIRAALSAAVAEFSVAAVSRDGMERTAVDRKFVTSLQMTIICCSSDIF